MLAVLGEARDGGLDTLAGKPAALPRAARYAQWHGLVRRASQGWRLTPAGAMLLSALEREERP